VLVQMTTRPLQELSRAHLRSRFPFPRSYDATVIDRLRKAGAKAIALDIEFTHETDVRERQCIDRSDRRAHGKTVLAATEVAPGGHTDVLAAGAVARTGRARRRGQADSRLRRLGQALCLSYNGLKSFPWSLPK